MVKLPIFVADWHRLVPKLMKIFKICAEVLVTKFTCAEVRLPDTGTRPILENKKLVMKIPTWISVNGSEIHFVIHYSIQWK